MAKPTTTPTWATDTNLSSGPASGTPTKVDPPAANEAQGFIPGVFFPSQWANWILYWLCQWIAWISGRGTPTTRTKVLRVDNPLTYSVHPPVDTQWDRVLTASRYAWEATLDNGIIFIPVDLPPGAVLRSISVRGKNNTGTVGNRLGFGLYRWTLDATETTSYEGGSDLGSGTTETTVTHTFTTPLTIDPATYRYAVRLIAGDVGDRFWGVQVSYDDPTMYGEA